MKKFSLRQNCSTNEIVDPLKHLKILIDYAASSQKYRRPGNL
jgi:hypothetical protein